MNDEERKYKFNKDDKLLFVDRDFWNIESVTVIDKRMMDSIFKPGHYFPVYFIRLENGTVLEMTEDLLFADKKDAVEKIISELKESKKLHQESVNIYQEKLDYFQSANFQMRYMGETLEGEKPVVEQKKTLIDLLQLDRASQMLNMIKSIQDNFCARYYLCNGCPIGKGSQYCLSHDINETTRHIDSIYFAEMTKCK